MRLPLNLLYLTLSILPSTFAIFADDAYITDYHHELLGLPQSHTTFFHRPRQDDKGTLLYTLSDLGVLGAVRPANGKVVWRQFLSGQNGTSEGGFLRPVEGESTVVSAIGQRVDAWDAATGRQRWGRSFGGIVKDLEVVETVPGGSEIRDVLLLVEDGGKGVLRRLNGATGDLIWEHKDGSDDVPLQASTNIKDIFLVSLHGAWGGYNVKVTILDPVTGKKTSEYTLAAKADVHAPEDILLVGANSASPIIAWTDKAMKNLKVNILGKSGSLSNLPLKSCDGDVIRVALHAPHLIQSLPHFLLHSFCPRANRADVFHIDIGTGVIGKAFELPKLPGSGVISTSSQDANVYFTRVTEDEVIIISSATHAILGRWPIAVGNAHGYFFHGVSEVVQRPGDSYAVRSALLTTVEDWILVQNGAEAWSRVEGLSGAVGAAWAEIPQYESLAKTLEDEAHQNPIAAYVHRVQRHIGELQHLPAYLQALPGRFLASILPAEAASTNTGALTRDSFGFNKIVVVATQRGRVYGLNAGNQGSVIWTTKGYELPQGKIWEVKGIWVENARSFVTIRGEDGGYVVLQSHTGRTMEAMPAGSSPTVESTVVVDSTKGKWLLIIGADGNPAEIEKEWAPTTTLVVKGSNEIRGLKFQAKGKKSFPVAVWTFQPGSGEKIVNIVARPAHDPVASIGVVLGDRTVLYKYLNPNTVLVTAVSEQSSTASFYLLDTISGEILHSESHEGVDTAQPITSALTENWFAYSFWGDVLSSTTTTPSSPSKGYQLIVSDLYESDVPNYRGPLGSAENSSSIEPSDIPNTHSLLPHVITQSFLIPQPISHMAVTQTRQGITTRQLLCILAEENSIIGIPRTVLDPRRPVGRDPTPAEQEEGLFRYSPVIEFDPKLVLSHRREVFGVKDVIATPAILESTSLVFAYGVDVFGTRVAPSAAFDILGKGFNRLSLVSTVLALGVGVGVLAPLVRRKQINGRWIAS